MVDKVKEAYAKELKKAYYHVEELKEMINSGDSDDLTMAFEKIGKIYKSMDLACTQVKDAMLDSEATLEEVRSFAQNSKTDLIPIRELKSELSQRLNDLERTESMKKEDELYKRKMDFELELIKKKNEEQQSKTQSVKLQKYTITPFTGDCRDWVRFWNQFKVEIDESSIPEISKFNYLLELVQGTPKEHILGLPHSPEGYNEAKKVLEMTYGKDNQVHKALIKDLESLPLITNIHKVKEIHEFYTKLSRTVRTLTTMKKLESSQAFTYSIMDKLGPVKEVIIQKDDDWEGWRLEDVVEHLRKYTDRNPLQSTSTDSVSMYRRTTDPRETKRKEKVMLASPPSQLPLQTKTCVYCELTNHRSKDCTKVLDIASRREVLKRKRLCYNCTRFGHSAAQCKSRGCGNCNGKHHTSLCDKPPATLDTTASTDSKQTKERFYSVLGVQTALHPTVIAKVNGVPARIMLDSGAGSSYISSNLLSELNIKPVRTERRVIEQMYGTVDKNVEVYNVEIQPQECDDFMMNLQCINAEKPTLTFLPNPNIPVLKSKYSHLSQLIFSDEDSQQENLPVHIILGVADLQRIKTNTSPVLGANPDIDPGAELTQLGWVIAGKSALHSSDTYKNFFLKSSSDEFNQMCSQEVFGLADPVDQDLCHEKFEEQICKQEDGSYSTRLPWKPDHSPLPEHKELALARLKSTTRKLDNLERIDEYHTIMQEQLDEGVIEPIPETPTGNVVHYVPHQPVIREEAESTKMRIVYDCSAKAKLLEPSLNDCLEVGPALQPMIFDILLRNRTRPLCIAGDIQKAFLQIHVDPEDRDAIRLLWYDNLEDRNIVAYRFSRVIFGSGPSPYILGATLHKHVSQYSDEYPNTVKELLTNTYVDDIQSGGDSVEQLLKFKEEATEIMNQAQFKLHKWHSNAQEVEGLATKLERSCESKILGVPWNKDEDTISVRFSPCMQQSSKGTVTKRQMLSSINQVFDVLGLVAPVMIRAKIIYSEVCLKKLKWDELIPEDEKRRWEKWLQTLRDCPVIKVPRSVVSANLVKMTLHGFSDASKWAVAVAIYILSYHSDLSLCQNLLVAKSRIAPRDQTIPRLELIGAHTLSRLINHVKSTLKELPISECHGWVDSTTVLHWIEGKGTWSRFVRNRTTDIKQKEYIQWHYVPTEENPSDIGSRGTAPKKLSEAWFKGPVWLPDSQKWPKQPDICETEEAKRETVQVKAEKQLLAKDGGKDENDLDLLLQHYSSYWKLLRVTALVRRFANNCRGAKLVGVLTTDEIQQAEKFWIQRAQSSQKLESNIDLQRDADGLWRCTGRVPNYNPIFLPRKHRLAALLVKQNHEKTLHGGVSSTMHQVREKLWVPKLRGLVKKVVHECNVCKRYRAQPITDASMSKSTLPEYRVEMSEPFTVTGVDFAGPVYHRLKNKATSKAYVALFTCASTRAVHLKLCRNLSAVEFQRALKEFVARRGCPSTIISDNGKTFVATGKWLKLLKKNQSLANYMASLDIKWKFNLSRAPWWGGFFERLVGIMKRALSKVVGRSLLSFQELDEVLIDVENMMNNRPLTYLGEEFEQPVITPNTLLRGRPNPVLEEELENLDEQGEMTKRIKFIQKTKADMRKRFVKEYVHALEERQPRLGEEINEVPKTGAVVLLKGDVKHRAQWKLGRVVSQVIGKDKRIRGLKIKLGNGYLIERPLQLVCPLEVGGEDQSYGTSRREEMITRVQPRRKTKDSALQMFKEIAHQYDIDT